MRPIDCHEPAERVLFALALQYHERADSREPGTVHSVELSKTGVAFVVMANGERNTAHWSKNVVIYRGRIAFHSLKDSDLITEAAA